MTTSSALAPFLPLLHSSCKTLGKLCSLGLSYKTEITLALHSQDLLLESTYNGSQLTAHAVSTFYCGYHPVVPKGRMGAVTYRDSDFYSRYMRTGSITLLMNTCQLHFSALRRIKVNLHGPALMVLD
jgi:hypothetical protein